MKPGSKGKYKFVPRWEEGIWLGLTDKSFEVIIGTSGGVIKVRDIKRKGEHEQWDIAKFNALQGVPWEPIPGREGIELKTRVYVREDKSPVDPPLQGVKEDLTREGFESPENRSV